MLQLHIKHNLAKNQFKIGVLGMLLPAPFLERKHPCNFLPFLYLKTAKDNNFKGYPEELLAQNMSYLSTVCSVSLKHLGKLNRWRTLKAHQKWSQWKSCSKEVILAEEKQEQVDVCQVIQEHYSITDESKFETFAAHNS